MPIKFIPNLNNFTVSIEISIRIFFLIITTEFDVRRVTIQKKKARATKLVPEIRHLSYENRLQALGISTLKARRIRLDLIQTYKILHGVDNVYYAKCFSLNANNTTNNGYQLEIKTHTTNTLGNSCNY